MTCSSSSRGGGTRTTARYLPEPDIFHDIAGHVPMHHEGRGAITAYSFDRLFDLVGELELWMRRGTLDHVAPGEPSMSEADVRSFLEA